MRDKKEEQLASTVLMIKPIRFESNSHTAESNTFQGKNLDLPEKQQIDASAEFEVLRDSLRQNGVNVIEVLDTIEPHTPDSIFPNNWVSFHSDGAVVLYPMMAPNRRLERRDDILRIITDEYNFRINKVVDLSGYEKSKEFLEGTGSLVLDRVNRMAYACMSPRTHITPLREFAKRMNYEVIDFDAVDRNGIPIYHTNVLMSIGEDFAFVCDEAIPNTKQRNRLMTELKKTKREVESINLDQMDCFAGNILQLRSSNNQNVVAMSSQAHSCLENSHLDVIGANSIITSPNITSIETSAGGSVRCMLAEIHLPKL